MSKSPSPRPSRSDRQRVGVHDRRVADFTEVDGRCSPTRPQRSCRCRCHASTVQECWAICPSPCETRPYSWQRKASWQTGLPVAGAPKRRGSASMVASHRSDAHDQHADNPADDLHRARSVDAPLTTPLREPSSLSAPGCANAGSKICCRRPLHSAAPAARAAATQKSSSAGTRPMQAMTLQNCQASILTIRPRFLGQCLCRPKQNSR